MPYVLTREAKDYIVKNCSKTGEQIRKEIIDKFGIDVTVQAILEHVKTARKISEEHTKTAHSVINQKISDDVSDYIDVIMDRYKTELNRIGDILDGNSEDFAIPSDKDDETKRSNYWYDKYARLYTTLAKDYIDMRPQIQTVEIKNTNDDVSYLELLNDEEQEYLDGIRKKFQNALSDTQTSHYDVEEGQKL